MALSEALNNKAGIQTTPTKIIPPRAENCLSATCQYHTVSGCALESCPFIKTRELNGANTQDANGNQNASTVLNADKQCFICKGNFKGFIGAVPICPTCSSRLTAFIANPYCPGCGGAVSKPGMICGSCKTAYLQDRY